MGKQSIALDEWLKEVEECSRDTVSERGLVARKDLAQKWDVCAATAGTRIGMLLEKGLLEYAGRERRVGYDFVMRPVPVYRLVKPANKKKK